MRVLRTPSRATSFGAVAEPAKTSSAASRSHARPLSQKPRGEQQQVSALRAAASLLENELKSTVTGLLLQSQLALAEPQLSPKLAGKLELVAELAGNLRRRLEQAQA